MRSSSVKTLVSVVSLTFALVASAPSAEARPSRPMRASQQTTRTQPGVTDRVQSVVRQLLQRIFGISSNELPSDPIPVNYREAGGPDELPTDPIPVVPVNP